MSLPLVLLTGNKRTLAGSRPTRSQAAAIRFFTAAMFAVIVASVSEDGLLLACVGVCIILVLRIWVNVTLLLGYWARVGLGLSPHRLAIAAIHLLDKYPSFRRWLGVRWQ